MVQGHQIVHSSQFCECVHGGVVCEDMHCSNIDNGKYIRSVPSKCIATGEELNCEPAPLQKLIGIRIDH